MAGSVNNSTQYEAACAAATLASERFLAVQKAYRAGEIGDAEYCAAHREHKAALAAFDVAYAAEQNRAGTD